MYVCICTGVTERQIREAAQRGVSDLTALRMATGCSTQCGSCAEQAQAILDEHFVSAQQQPPRVRIFNVRIASAA